MAVGHSRPTLTVVAALARPAALPPVFGLPAAVPAYAARRVRPPVVASLPPLPPFDEPPSSVPVSPASDAPPVPLLPPFSSVVTGCFVTAQPAKSVETPTIVHQASQARLVCCPESLLQSQESRAVHRLGVPKLASQFSLLGPRSKQRDRGVPLESDP